MHITIAIDGPAGAGKSTIARMVSKQLSCIYVDTGAMYRTIGLYMLRNKIATGDEAAVCENLGEVEVMLEYTDGLQQIFLNGENVSEEIRKEEVGDAASDVSRYALVRKKMIELQRGLAMRENIVMDGRDIGTSVLPDAGLKVYLTADTEVRAKRRYDELIGKGLDADLSELGADIEARDHQDMTREISPLKKAEDAVLIDSSKMTIDEVVEKIVALAEKIYD